ncbi:hypothetical protein ACX12E_17915 [Paenibacillus vandeheii]
MFYYKGAFRETDNFIYFKSDVQLVENDVVIFGESVKSLRKHFLFQVYVHFWAAAYIQ